MIFLFYKKKETPNSFSNKGSFVKHLKIKLNVYFIIQIMSFD